MPHRKKFSEFGRGKNEEKNAKIAVFIFKHCGMRQGLKNTQKSPISMNKKFSMNQKKTAKRKICLYSRVTQFVKVWGVSLHKQKKMKKNSRSRMDFFLQKSKKKVKYLKN